MPAPFIPPWLNLDPIEPVRLGMQARAQRNQREAAEVNDQIAREKMQQDALQTAAALQAKQEQDAVANELKREEMANLLSYRQE